MVVTSSVDDSTLVVSSESIQLQKWSASISPPRTAACQPARDSRGMRRSCTAQRISVESATRQKAVTTAGASASRTQSAALEIASSAATSTTAASRRPGAVGAGEDSGSTEAGKV